MHCRWNTLAATKNTTCLHTEIKLSIQYVTVLQISVFVLVSQTQVWALHRICQYLLHLHWTDNMIIPLNLQTLIIRIQFSAMHTETTYCSVHSQYYLHCTLLAGPLKSMCYSNYQHLASSNLIQEFQNVWTLTVDPFCDPFIWRYDKHQIQFWFIYSLKLPHSVWR